MLVVNKSKPISFCIRFSYEVILIMAAVMKLNEIETATFIELFQSCECLWNVALGDYHRRRAAGGIVRNYNAVSG